MTDYRSLYEAAVEHIEAMNQWAAERGIVLPDTDTAGSDQSERIRTLEDALRPFAGDAAGHHVNEWARTTRPGSSPVCSRDGLPWPCKYETARRALEGE